MFCRNCGAQLKEGAKFCPKCGTPVTQTQSTAGQQYDVQPGQDLREGPGLSGAAGVKKTKKAPAFAIGAVIILVIAVILIVRACAGGGGYEKPIRNLMEGIENRDIDQLLKAFPDEMFEDDNENERDEIAEEIENAFNYSIGSVHLFDIDYKLSYEIDDEFDLSDREVKEIEDQFEGEDIDVTVKAGKEVDLTMTISIEALDYEGDQQMTLEVIKIGGSWYINPFSM